MMRNIFKTLFFFILITSASCTKENNQLGNGKVKVNSIGYKFNDVITKSNKSIQERVIASSALELDENYILIGELVETNEEIINTKQYTYEDVTAVKVLTFYQQDAKTENRLQDLDMTNKTFELPPEGGCDVVFLGNVGGTSPTISIDNSKDEATVTSVVETGTNLCYLIKSYGNSIPATENLSNMTPLFAQIGEIVVPELTIDNWSIEAINNLKITAGNQASSGDITINKSTVRYAPTNKDSEVIIGSFKGNTTTKKDLNVIPNGNNFVIKADIKLTNKTNSVNLSFNFDQPIVSGKRYKLNFSVRRNGISIKFYTNTQQLGVYSKTFDDAQQETIKNSNSSSIATEKDGKVYYKYGSTIVLPTKPQKASDDYYNPNYYMEFYKWSKQQDCKDGLLDNSIELNETNFPELKTSDVVNLYAYYHPIFYYWNGSENAYNYGVYGLSKNDLYDLYTSSGYSSSFSSTSSVFSKTPKAADYKKYFGTSAVFFYDSGYTDDNQQGYWIQKWSTAQKNTPREVINSNAYEDVSPKGTIINGDFSKSNYNKSDFFFLPILGFYYPQEEETPYALNNSGNGGATDGAFWSKDVKQIYDYYSSTTSYVSQGISLLENGKGIRLYGQDGVNEYVGLLVRGFSPIGDYTFVGRNALLAQWPDDTYSGN